MRKFRKPLSLLLALMLALSLFGVCATASAAETQEPSAGGHTGTITVTSNVAQPVTVDFHEYNDTVTVTYSLQSTHKIVNTQATVHYDSSVLQLDEIDLDTNFPVLNNGSLILNTNIADNIYLNASKINFFSFKNQRVYYTQTFNIIGDGDTTVNLEMEILTGSDQDDPNLATSENDVELVTLGTVVTDEFTFTANAELSGEEPATDGATIKVVVPDSYLQTYKWNSVDLYYTSKSTYDEADHLAMTKTDDVYYVNTANDNIKSIVNASGWSVYSITLTPEQVATLDSSRLVGFSAGNNLSRTKFSSANNIFKAAVGAYGNYNTTAASAASFDGYTFVICNSLSSGKAAYTAYTGYWTEGYTTVKFAAPVADTMRSTWDNVNFCYGDSYENSTAVAMANTLETTKVTDVGDMSTLKPGRWYIFAVTLDAAQTEAANTAAYVGFTKPGDTNRTAPSKNVLKALTNEFTGTYGDARTLQELEGQVFMVKANATASSLLTFNGEWETEDVYTAHNSDTVKIFFAAPTADKDSGAWNTGVELYYTLNNSTNYKTAEKIEMTEETGSYTANLTGTNLSAISSGDWKLYSVELSEDQIVAIDRSNNVGFIKKGSYNRTSILYTKDITKASKTEDHTYSTKKQTIEAFDGFVFVIDSCADTANERTSYTGFWEAASAKG